MMWQEHLVCFLTERLNTVCLWDLWFHCCWALSGHCQSHLFSSSSLCCVWELWVSGPMLWDLSGERLKTVCLWDLWFHCCWVLWHCLVTVNLICSHLHLSAAAVWVQCIEHRLWTGSYTARDTLREWQDKNHPWLELTDIHRETTENIRVTVMPFYIGSRVSTVTHSQQCDFS